MMLSCPVSCGVCTTNCTDASEHCTAWAQKGECTSNRDFMLRECPTTCGLCTPVCEDSHGGIMASPSTNETACEMWAREGACEHNHEFMLNNCPVSCGVCAQKCKDSQSSCSAWAANGECRTNSAFMFKECPKACEVCHANSPCENKHDNATECGDWKRSGECETNPEFMLRTCSSHASNPGSGRARGTGVRALLRLAPLPRAGARRRVASARVCAPTTTSRARRGPRTASARRTPAL